MKSREQNRQKAKGSQMKPSKEFKEKWRQIRIRELRKAYFFKKNKSLEKFIYENNFQNRVFYYEYLIEQIENKKDTISEEKYNAFKKYLTGEIAGREDAVNEWLSEEINQEISEKDETGSDKRSEEILQKEDKEIPEEKPAPREPEVILDELTKEIETEEAEEKCLHDYKSHITDLQKQKARESIEKIESSINELKTSLNGAVNNLKKKKDWLISEKEKQGEIDFGEIKEKPSQVLQDVIIEVPKDFSPENIERILTPLKMKVQYQQAKLIKLLKLLDYNRNYLNREKR